MSVLACWQTFNKRDQLSDKTFRPHDFMVLLAFNECGSIYRDLVVAVPLHSRFP